MRQQGWICKRRNQYYRRIGIGDGGFRSGHDAKGRRRSGMSNDEYLVLRLTGSLALPGGRMPFVRP